MHRDLSIEFKGWGGGGGVCVWGGGAPDPYNLWKEEGYMQDRLNFGCT